jgi:hypothetical protein
VPDEGRHREEERGVTHYPYRTTGRAIGGWVQRKNSDYPSVTPCHGNMFCFSSSLWRIVDTIKRDQYCVFMFSFL